MSDTTNNNLQPYQAVNFVIATGDGGSTSTSSINFAELYYDYIGEYNTPLITFTSGVTTPVPFSGKYDPSGIITLNSPSLTLNAGTYSVNGFVSLQKGSGTSGYKITLYDTTNSTILVYGKYTSQYNSSYMTDYPPIGGSFILSSTSTLQLRVRSDGDGWFWNFSDSTREIGRYAYLKITKFL